ncbi:MAG: FAD-dependent oxidoreductase, partial [Acidobacteriota bacterium]|nr:FAD-dependent oxidoreductase [Acidobacteriota bacterium]
MHVAVVGAGAFGGWTALSLVRRGARVTVLDAWGPGNSRASSGGETRVIRAGYGNRHLYIPMVARALGLWRENQERWGTRVLEQTGVLWIFSGDDGYLADAIPVMRENGFEVQPLEPAEAGRRYTH